MSHKPMQSCAVLFAELGNPWATPEDWTREQKLAQNPRVATRVMENARNYVAGARKRDLRRAEPKPKFVEKIAPAPVSERARAMMVERENLKLMLAGLGACERTIVPAVAPAERPIRVIGSDREMIPAHRR